MRRVCRRTGANRTWNDGNATPLALRLSQTRPWPQGWVSKITAYTVWNKGFCPFLNFEPSMPSLRILPLLLLLTLACSGNTSPNASPDPNASDQARVRVENRSSIDMDIYLVRTDGQSIRLGFVGGGETSTFALPATVTAGTTSITFQARPVRRSGRAVNSEPFGLSRGEEIQWSIPPQ